MCVNLIENCDKCVLIIFFLNFKILYEFLKKLKVDKL